MKSISMPKSLNKYLYIGLTNEQASRRALELTKIAAETGQTDLLREHLNLLHSTRANKV